MMRLQPVLMMLRVLIALTALTALLVLNTVNAQNLNTNIRLLNIAGEPIKLALSVGQEVQLNFEQPLGRLGTPQSIKNKLQTQLIDQRLWLKATKTFKPVRVLVRSEQGDLSVFLLSANVSQQKIQAYPIKYTVITEAKLSNQSNSRSNSHQQNSNTKPALTYVDLTRFAAQSLYGPKRLIKNINLIRLPINTKQAVRLFTCSTALTCNGNVLAHPIATWQSPRFYITAVLLKNTTQQQIVLDPRDLLGTWKATTFHFNRLGKCQVSPRCSLFTKSNFRNISGSLINKSGFKLYQYSKAS